MKAALRFAWFVTPHGFGHAARTAAIVEALGRRLPQVEVELWTSVPSWFFAESLTVPFRRRELACDVGLVQRSPVEEDLPASLAALARFWTAADQGRTAEVAAAVAASGARCVIADIAPFGLAVARAAGLPSVLVENFTWDWIYEPLAAVEPQFALWAERLRREVARPDLHLQLEPFCRPVAGAQPVPPVARAPRRQSDEIFARLSLPPGDAVVLVSLGGVEHRLSDLAPLAGLRGVTCVIPGACPEERWEGNLRLLPHHSPIHHPDLVAVADVVVGKLGYSTVAETVAAGGRMLYVPRPGFRESAVLERYVGERLPAAAISFAELESGAWVDQLPCLLARPRPSALVSSGAEVAAELIAGWWATRDQAAS
ncbi:MAG: hypothetical protein ABI689_17395 [Thermoanaerobaculia bacterium]